MTSVRSLRSLIGLIMRVHFLGRGFITCAHQAPGAKGTLISLISDLNELRSTVSGLL